MSFDINDIKSQLQYGGARNTLFQVNLVNMGSHVADFKSQFMIRASSIPAASLGNISVPYFGRKINLAGDRTYGNWSTTIINDEDFLVRNAMEQWSNSINTFQGNIRAYYTARPLEYKSDATVVQYGKKGNIIREYIFHGIYPTEVSNIELDWNATDRIEEFSVTFMYDYWEVQGITGDAGGPDMQAGGVGTLGTVTFDALGL